MIKDRTDINELEIDPSVVMDDLKFSKNLLDASSCLLLNQSNSKLNPNKVHDMPYEKEEDAFSLHVSDGVLDNKENLKSEPMWRS